MPEQLEGMSTEQLMLRDFIYELSELLDAADKEEQELPGYRLGVRAIAKLIEHKLEVFGIDLSQFARQLPDIDRWYFGKAHD